MQSGSHLGPYVIDRELGSGGMGRVFAATGPDGVVALKIVHPHLLETADAIERFTREVEMGRAVDHPNVVRTFGGGADDGHHFMAMEYVEGQTLDALLTELERVPEDLCRHIASEVAKGLAAIHEGGAIHRDIKPENVLITPDHVVKIMDLGVARSMDDAMRLSQTGAFVGSLHYASPEQFTGGGKGLDGRVDLHALGLVMYELATGVCPYHADDVPQTLRKVLHEEPRRLGEINPQLSAFFEELVHCLIAKDRDERFATATELTAVLSEGEDSTWWHARASMIRSLTKRPLRRVRIPRETAVYGRESELAKLRSCFDSASAGEGRVLLIEGEAGIGKSRLIDELIGRVHRDDEDINFLFGSYPPGGAATASGGFSTAYREQFGEAGSADYLPTTPVLVPAFDALLRGESTPKGEEPLTKGSLQTCFVNATRALAAERTTVVLIDDLHFAPDEGRALFTTLAMAAPGHRLLLIGTTRPGVPSEWLSGLTRLDHTELLELHRLGPKDLVVLLQDTLRSEQLARDLGNQIAVKSDGNPFFVFEILRGLREGQFIQQEEDGTWVGTRVIDDIEIPSSVLDLVNARVSDLTEEERDLLDLASCLGFQFDPGLVAAALDVPLLPTLKRFGQIERRHRLVRANGRRYAFDHHQVQEALYASIFEQVREAYHSALADALEARTNAAGVDPATLDGDLCVSLCEHLLAGAQAERAVRYLDAATAHLTRSYLHADVVSLTQRALDAPGVLTGSERAKHLRALAQGNGPLDSLGRRAEQEAYARESQSVAASVGDTLLEARALKSLGNVLYRTSRYSEASVALERSVELAAEVGDRKLEITATGTLGNVAFAEGAREQAREYHERHLDLSREIGHKNGEAVAHGNLGVLARVEGRLEDARHHTERFLAISVEIGDRISQTMAIGNLGGNCVSEGRWQEARDAFERHLAASREVGHRQGEAVAIGNLGNAFLHEGRTVEACESYARTLTLCREIGDAQGEAIAYVHLGIGKREVGETELALEYAREAVDRCVEFGFRNVIGAARYALGSLSVEVGDIPGAIEMLSAARDDAAGTGDIGIETLARCALAGLPDGDPADAVAAFADHGSLLRDAQLLAARLLVWRATGDAAHVEAAKRALDESVAQVDPAYRESMLANIRVNREIMAAWETHAAG